MATFNPAEASEQSGLLEGDLRFADDVEAGEEVPEVPEGTVGWYGTVFNLTTVGLGAGILSMPAMMASAGILNALIAFVVGFVIQYWTMMMLVKASEKHQIFVMEELVKKLPHGKLWFWVCTINIWLVFLGCLVGYVVSFQSGASELLRAFQNNWDFRSGQELRHELAKGASGNSQWGGRLDFANFAEMVPEQQTLYTAFYHLFQEEVESATWVKWVLYITFGGVAGGMSFLSTKALSTTSLVTVALNVLIVLFIVLNFFMDGFDQDWKWISKLDVCYFGGLNTGTIGVFSGFLMAACVHPCIPCMYQDMQERSVAKFSSALIASFVLLMALFLLFCFFGYFTYGDALMGNVLLNFDNTRWYAFLSHLSICVVVACVYPLILQPIVVNLTNPFVKTVATIGLVITSVFLAMIMGDKLDMVNNYAGAASAFFILCFFPGMIAWHLLDGYKTSCTWKSLLIALYVFGLIMMVLGVMFPEANIAFKLWAPLTVARLPVDPAPAIPTYGFDNTAAKEQFEFFETLPQWLHHRTTDTVTRTAELETRTQAELECFREIARAGQAVAQDAELWYQKYRQQNPTAVTEPITAEMATVDAFVKNVQHGLLGAPSSDLVQLDDFDREKCAVFTNLPASDKQAMVQRVDDWRKTAFASEMSTLRPLSNWKDEFAAQLRKVGAEGLAVGDVKTVLSALKFAIMEHWEVSEEAADDLLKTGKAKDGNVVKREEWTKFLDEFLQEHFKGLVLTRTPKDTCVWRHGGTLDFSEFVRTGNL